MLVRLPLVLGQVEGVRLDAGRVVRESELLQRAEEVDLAHQSAGGPLDLRRIDLRWVQDASTAFQGARGAGDLP